MAKGSTNAIIVVGGGGASGFTVPACSNVTARSAGGKIYIKWTDPDDIYDGTKEISWTKSEVRLIVGGDSRSSAYPKKITDGTLVGTFTTKNQYQSTELEFTPPSTIGSDVYCSIMVYAHCSISGDTKDYVNGEFKSQSSDAFKIQSYSTWTVVIDESNSNPLSCCTYGGDAVGMTKGSDEWDSIFGYRPCVFKDGAVVFYLDPNDWTKDANGNTTYNGIPIASLISSDYYDSGYDVMIEFPRMGLNINKSGTEITISLTDDPNNSNFGYLAHERDTVAKNSFYLGAYQACENTSGANTLLRSVSGGTIAHSYTSTEDFWFHAESKGTGYTLFAFYQITYLQALYILKYGNLNSQSAIGSGRMGSVLITNGSLNSNGMNYSAGTNGAIKLFGLENLWGNYDQGTIGAEIANSGYTLTTNTNLTYAGGYGSSQRTTTLTIGSSVNGLMTASQGSTNAGFIIANASGGSTSTYYCDYCTITTNSARYGRYGGDASSDANGGIFNYNLAYGTTGGTLYTSRLMYL